MGVFADNCILFNRAPVNLTVLFDGQSKTLTPGENIVPEQVVGHAKNQNPIMGSQDPNNPHISGAQYLVGVAAHLDNVTPLTKQEWETHLGRPCRTDEQAAFEEKYGGDPKARLVTIGKGKKSTASSRSEAGGSEGGRGNSSFNKEA